MTAADPRSILEVSGSRESVEASGLHLPNGVVSQEVKVRRQLISSSTPAEKTPSLERDPKLTSNYNSVLHNRRCLTTVGQGTKDDGFLESARS